MQRHRFSSSTSLTGILSVLRTSPIRTLALLFFACFVAVSQPVRADMGVVASSEQSTYLSGQTNRLVFDLYLISQVYEGADNIYFTLPAGVTISSVQILQSVTNCNHQLLLALGMGTSEGGWYNPSYPTDGCGHFFGFPSPGALQRMAVDIDVPANYIGDLPIVVTVNGDRCCDPPPHDARVTFLFADAGPPRWNFDDVVAPARPAGWITTTAGAGIAWSTQGDIADTAPNAAYAPTTTASGEASLAMSAVPWVLVPADGGELHFRQRFNTEAGHDGGVLEIAIDSGAFEDILAAGGQFISGAYNGELDANAGCSGADANPLVGRAAWTGEQDTFETVAVNLPAAAAGLPVQLRWRLGTDCAGQATVPYGWWVDGVSVTSNAPHPAIGPARIAVSTDVGVQRVETLGIGNIGNGVLTYSVAIADGGATDCSVPANPSWLHLAAPSGSVAGGARAEVPIELDSSGLANGQYAALLCVTTNDASTPSKQIPLVLTVTAGSCQAVERIFANGFDDASDGHAARRCEPSIIAKRSSPMSPTATTRITTPACVRVICPDRSTSTMPRTRTRYSRRTARSAGSTCSPAPACCRVRPRRTRWSSHSRVRQSRRSAEISGASSSTATSLPTRT